VWFIHHFVQFVAWGVAAAWIWRSADAALGVPGIPDLAVGDQQREPVGAPSLTVIVPARNEAADIRQSLESLVRQDYPGVQVVAVNDRSTDATGATMDALAAEWPGRLRVVHVTELPSEWLGKTHAMALAAAGCTTDFLLFTDADVTFAPSALRLALAEAVLSEADHLVLAPTTIIKRWDEAALLAFFQMFGVWAARPWKVADPKAKRDAVGIGAFNMLRRSAYEAVGGYQALRMEVVEDLGIARRIKQAGLRQRLVFGKGLVSIHWAAGVPGLMGVMTKNVFAAAQFKVGIILGGCAWLLGVCAMPFLMVWTPGLRLAGWVAIASMAWAYRVLERHSGLSVWNVLAAPLAAGVFCFVMLRSTVTTLRQGGVVWRGTFYSLAELKKHVAPWP
jgi:glycosyltransferase involved in cell wall biosynthesis